MRQIAACAVLAGLLAGCGSREYVANEVHTIPLTGQTNIRAHNFNGNMSIVDGVDTDEMRVEAVKRVSNRMGAGDAGKRVSDITVTAEDMDDTIDVTADYPRRGVWRYVVDFNITTPPGFQHNIDIGDGNLVLDITTPRLAVNIGNGDATGDVTLQDGGTAHIGVGNGDITLYLPRDTNASLNIEVGHGEIDTSELTVGNVQETNERLTGVLGDGGGTIRLLTGNGNITIRYQ